MRKPGFLLIVVSPVLFFVDRGTHLLSDTLGRFFCGKNYLRPVDGAIGDGSCGFNADMYLTSGLALLGLLGILLAFLSSQKNGKH